MICAQLPQLLFCLFLVVLMFNVVFFGRPGVVLVISEVLLP